MNEQTMYDAHSSQNPLLKFEQLKKSQVFSNKSMPIPQERAHQLPLEDVSLFKTLKRDRQHHCGFSSHLQQPCSQDVCAPKVENRPEVIQHLLRGVKGHCGIPAMPAVDAQHLLKEDFCRVNSKAKHSPLEYVTPSAKRLLLATEYKMKPEKPVRLCSEQGRLREWGIMSNLG